jgi:hypothetical protein
MPFFGPEAGLNRARQVFVDMHAWSSCTERPHHCCHAPCPSCTVGERPRHFNALCLTLPHSPHLHVPSTRSLSRSPRSDARVDTVRHGREHSSLSLLRCHLRSYSPLTEASNSVAMPYPLLCARTAALLATGEPTLQASHWSRPMVVPAAVGCSRWTGPSVA